MEARISATRGDPDRAFSTATRWFDVGWAQNCAKWLGLKVTERNCGYGGCVHSGSGLISQQGYESWFVLDGSVVGSFNGC